MLLYNDSPVHNAKYEPVGTCQCDWAFRLGFCSGSRATPELRWTRGGKRQWVSTR